MKKLLLLSTVILLTGCSADSHYIFDRNQPIYTDHDKQVINFDINKNKNFICQDRHKLSLHKLDNNQLELNYTNFLDRGVILNEVSTNVYTDAKNLYRLVLDGRNVIISKVDSDYFTTCSSYETEEERKARIEASKKAVTTQPVETKQIVLPPKITEVTVGSRETLTPKLKQLIEDSKKEALKIEQSK